MKEDQKVWPWAFLPRLAVLAAVLGAAFLLTRGPVRPAVQAMAGAGVESAAVWGVRTVASSEMRGRQVIPMGRAVGIKLFSDGVMVVGFSEIATEAGCSAPARDCGLQEGDVITHINNTEVDTIEEVQAVLQELEGAPMSIRALREDKQVQMSAQAAQCSSDGCYKLGAWIRDSMAGIGTVTFYDPATGTFGALGHGINDVDTARLMPLQAGSIMYAEVTDVKKGASGDPGELHGAFQVSQDMGDLYANTASGVFGTLSDQSLAAGLQPMEVAVRSEVRMGPAVIRSNIAGEEVVEYQVEITRIYPANGEDTRNLMIKVTDPALLEATGGIVQGMSGSPILQNGRIVGAVTHVLVNDPTRGYGIFIENMLEAADYSQK